MRVDKTRRKTVGLRVQDIGHITLLPKLDRLGLVIGDMGVPHPREHIAQLLRIRACEFDKFEPIGSGGVFGRDLGFRCVVRERAHEMPP